jgi:hypothetical protein
MLSKGFAAALASITSNIIAIAGIVPPIFQALGKIDGNNQAVIMCAQLSAIAQIVGYLTKGSLNLHLTGRTPWYTQLLVVVGHLARPVLLSVLAWHALSCIGPLRVHQQ